MKRTEILCPECMKKKLLTDNGKDAHCDGCGTEFEIVGITSVKYKK
jgi:hypothetical protein